MNRRGFFGWLAGGVSYLMGRCMTGGKDVPPPPAGTDGAVKRLVEALRKYPPGRWTCDYYRPALDIFNGYGGQLLGPDQTAKHFVEDIVRQWELTGMALVWEIPNSFGQVVEVRVVPTARAIPQPPNADYPDGHYRIVPVCSEAVTNTLIHPAISAVSVRRYLAPR